MRKPEYRGGCAWVMAGLGSWALAVGTFWGGSVLPEVLGRMPLGMAEQDYLNAVAMGVLVLGVIGVGCFMEGYHVANPPKNSTTGEAELPAQPPEVGAGVSKYVPRKWKTPGEKKLDQLTRGMGDESDWMPKGKIVKKNEDSEDGE